MVPVQTVDVLSYVRNRLDVTSNQNRKYVNLVKGNQGEQKFYRLLTERLPSNYTILTDLLFRFDGTEFQIDILLIGEKYYFPIRSEKL